MLSSLLLAAAVIATIGGSAVAQGPVQVEHKPGQPYAVFPYSFSEYTVTLSKGHLGFAAWNDFETQSEVWIQGNGRTIDRGTFRYDTFHGFDVPQDGQYTVSINGRGRFALVDATLTDKLLSDHNASVEHLVNGRLAIALIAHFDGAHICVDPSGPVSLQVVNQQLLVDRSVQVSGATEFPVSGEPESSYLLFEAAQPTKMSLRVRSDAHPCALPPVAAASGGVGRAPGASLVWLAPALLGLAILMRKRE
jgi:hypothetical protein